MHVATALVVVLLLLACGGDEAGVGSQLDGRDFLSQSVDGHALVAGTQIRLRFDDGQLGADAGCNSLGVGYEVADDRLVTKDGMTTTDMGCDAPRHAQDAWLADLLAARPRIALDGDALTLTTADAVLHLLDRVVADPDRPLLGTRWRVDTVLRGDAASSVPAGGSVVLELRSGTLTASSPGCTSARIDVEVDERRHTLRFGEVLVDAIGCPSPWADAIELLRSGSARYEIDAARLTITAGDVGVAAIAD